MDFFRLLQVRRSIRDFEPKEVPLEIVREIISDSCLAPSASNRQPWNFIVVRNKALIKKISDTSKRNLLRQVGQNANHPLKQYESALKDDSYNVFYNAPCLVLITSPSELSSSQVDCALVASYFMLSAAARGLGTCWVGLGAHIGKPESVEGLAIPAGDEVVAPIILGYPKAVPAPMQRAEPRIEVIS